MFVRLFGFLFFVVGRHFVASFSEVLQQGYTLFVGHIELDVSDITIAERIAVMRFLDILQMAFVSIEAPECMKPFPIILFRDRNEHGEAIPLPYLHFVRASISIVGCKLS